LKRNRKSRIVKANRGSIRFSGNWKDGNWNKLWLGGEMFIISNLIRNRELGI